MNRTNELTADPSLPADQSCPRPEFGPDNRTPVGITTARHWLGKGFWAIMDQGLFAGANFMVNVLLARWVSPEEYGSFTVAFMVFLLLGTIHTALLTEPMLVFGPKRYRHRLGPYLSTLLRLHVVVCAFAAVILGMVGVAGYVFGATLLARACLAFALAQPFILFLWLMRRACYVRSQPRPAAIAGLAYLVLMAAGLSILNRIGLSVERAVGMMALCAAFAGGALWLTQFRGEHEDRHHGIATTAYKRHMGYARWSVPAALCGFMGGYIYFFILPQICGLVETGAVRAAMNLVMPAIHIIIAMSPLVIVQLSSLRSPVGFLRKIRSLLMLFGLASASYWGILIAWGPNILHWVYAGKYDSYEFLLPIVGILPLLAGVIAVLRPALLARGLWRQAFYGSLATLVFALSGGIAMVLVFGMPGAIFSMATGMLIQALSHTFFLLFHEWHGGRLAVGE